MAAISHRSNSSQVLLCAKWEDKKVDVVHNKAISFSWIDPEALQG